jgi:predicted PurR-regulated permease PerM
MTIFFKTKKMTDTYPVPFYKKLAYTLISLTLICLMIYLGNDIIAPFAFAVLLSILLLPITNFLERLKMPKVIASLVAIFSAIIFISGIVYFLSWQVSGFVQDIPSIKSHLSNHFHTVQKWVYQQFNFTVREQTKFINNATDKMKNSGTGALGQTFLSVTQLIMVLVLVPVYTFLILYYRNMIRKFLIALFKDEHEPRVKEVLTESRSIVQGYMMGLIIEMVIVASINAMGFFIAGIQYAIFLGVLSAILNMIPYIGMLIAAIICMLITLTTSTHFSDIIWVAIVLTLVQFIDNNIIMPKVVSSKVKVNAMISILGVLIGAALAGISGMFLSIPAIAILKVIFDRVEGLEPWGILLGDETEVKKNKIYRKLENIKFKKMQKKVAVVN